MKRLPQFLKKYFWDVQFEKINLQENREYILRRILNYGDERAVAWMYANFEKSEMRSALTNFRGYSQKSANYWSLMLDVPREKVICLKKHSSKEQKTFWPY
jgi:CRISPR/Cas system-associated protein Cas10 (large subunit of type III CRISPR-Cas system)